VGWEDGGRAGVRNGATQSRRMALSWLALVSCSLTRCPAPRARPIPLRLSGAAQYPEYGLKSDEIPRLLVKTFYNYLWVLPRGQGAPRGMKGWLAWAGACKARPRRLAERPRSGARGQEP
jgi:hypothetical protein